VLAYLRGIHYLLLSGGVRSGNARTILVGLMILALSNARESTSPIGIQPLYDEYGLDLHITINVGFVVAIRKATKSLSVGITIKREMPTLNSTSNGGVQAKAAHPDGSKQKVCTYH